MTVKEFAQKYGIDYSIVYNATWLIEDRPQFPYHGKQYEEDKLKTAVMVAMANRMDRHRREFQKAASMLKKVSI